MLHTTSSLSATVTDTDCNSVTRRHSIIQPELPVLSCMPWLAPTPCLRSQWAKLLYAEPLVPSDISLLPETSLATELSGSSRLINLFQALDAQYRLPVFQSAPAWLVLKPPCQVAPHQAAQSLKQVVRVLRAMLLIRQPVLACAETTSLLTLSINKHESTLISESEHLTEISVLV